MKKSWYVGPEADRAKIAKWDPKHQAAPTLDPRAEFAAVLREIGAVVAGDHPIMNGEAQRIPATKDKPGEIAATPGAPTRNGDVLVPGYDVDGKLWTVQYIKEDGTKRFAKNSRKHGCFHLVGAPNGAAALQKIAMSPVVVIAEGYATAATLAEHGKVPTLAAAEVVAGVAIFPSLTAEQRGKGFTDFNDLGIQNPEVVSRQLNEVLQGLREQRSVATQSIELARTV